MSDEHKDIGKEQSSRTPETSDSLLSRRNFIGGTVAGMGAMGLAKAG